MALLEIKGLQKNFGELKVLKDINVSIDEGEVLVLIGPSGSGKSTFLRCLNLLEAPSGGEIIYKGENILKRKFNIRNYRQKVGMCFQRFNLFPFMTVLDNVTYAPVHNLKKKKAEAQEKAMGLLEKVGLADKAKVYPETLSGGQQQRVAIARALVTNPSILLADEPTGALDQKTGTQVIELFEELNRDGRTIIMITHDSNIARHAKRIVHILDGNLSEQEV